MKDIKQQKRGHNKKQGPGWDWDGNKKKKENKEKAEKEAKEAKIILGSGASAYIIYRGVRMLPSLAPPLWPTIVPNAIAP